MVILDTNIIIDHLRHRGNGVSFLQKLIQKHPKEVLCISIFTVQELYEGKSTKESEKEKDMLATISPLKILPYTYDIAEKAGVIARDASRFLECADAAIAATALIHQIPLATLNTKDFTAIEGIELFEL